MPLLHLDDAELHYEVHGEGPPFLFMSQTATAGGVWKPFQVPEFARDHRVITYDQRGTGRSATPARDFSTRRLAADAAALLAHLGAEGAIVCGHSNGGRVAQALTLDHPGMVKRLILASSGGTHHSKGIPIKMCMELVEKGYERYVRDHSVEVGFTKEFIKEHPSQVEACMTVLLEDLPTLEVFLGHVVGRQEYDATPRLKDIRVPTLVMVGEDEDHGSSHGITHLQFAKSLAASIPGAQLSVIPGHGHYYPLAAPATMHRIVRDFLAR
jgi:pimeloyl-ACP methyl ester carboxylesterase